MKSVTYTIAWLTSGSPSTYSITIAVGDTVSWVWGDNIPHTVTSGTTAADGKFSSGPASVKSTFNHTFTAAGSYPYFCIVQPLTMKGIINVVVVGMLRAMLIVFGV
jgi:plastocyanin